MLNAMIESSLQNRFLVIVGTLLIAGLGIFSAVNLPIDAVPDLTNIQVQVITEAPALSPLEVETLISFPVEGAMSGLPNVKQIRSISKFGISVVTLVFKEGTDLYRARQLVGERLARAAAAIPRGYGTPTLGPITTALGEVFQFQVKATRESGVTPMELRSILDWFVAYQLRGVPGVTEINSHGGELKTYQVELDPDKLGTYRLSMSDVFNALRMNNADVGGGYLVHEGEARYIRGESQARTVADIAAIVIDERNGVPVTIADVAKVHPAPMIRAGLVTRDGQGEIVTGLVMMLIGENSRRVVGHVKEEIARLQGSLPAGVTIVPLYDRAHLIDQTLSTVLHNLVEGGVLVIVVLLALLGNFRGGLIVALAIPLSMLFAANVMLASGVTASLMSLGAIDFGMLVDSSVIMIENCVRRLAHEGGRAQARHHPRRGDRGPQADHVRRADHRHRLPADPRAAGHRGEALPADGVDGHLRAGRVDGALADADARARLARAGVEGRGAGSLADPDAQVLLHAGARRGDPPPGRCGGAGDRAGGRQRADGAAAGGEFMPRLNEGDLLIEAVRIPSASLEGAVPASTQIENIVKRFPEVRMVYSKTGRPEIANDVMGVHQTDVWTLLKPQDKWRPGLTRDALIEEMDKALTENVPGVKFGFSQPIEMRVNELVAGVKSDVAVLLYGTDLDVLRQKAAEIERVLAHVPGAQDIKTPTSGRLPMLRISVRRDQLARYGIKANDVLEAVAALGGTTVGTVFEKEGRRFFIQVRLPESWRNDPEKIQSIRIVDTQGRPIALRDLADVTFEEGPSEVERENVRRRAVVGVNVRGRDIAGFVAEAQAAIRSKVELPPGYLIRWGGQFEHLQTASRRLMIVVPIALALIFLLLFTTFNSLRLAALIYLAVPMAATGGVFSLAWRGLPFSISAGVGFIALFGVAVLNGLVWVSAVEHLRIAGVEPHAAAHEAALVRLRPILMTALVAGFGFVPMATSTTPGAEIQRPLATVVIGGLVTSTLLTALVLPAIYPWFAEKPKAVGM